MQISHTIKPANIWLRVYANVLDTFIVLSILYVISLWQEDGPPATGMSFYTKQQFTNYFILVYIACMLVIANGLLMNYSPSKKTIGQLVFGLSLVRLDGHPATEKQVRSRVFRTLGAVIFICIPGPIIALIIAFVVGVIFSIPFSTGNAMLIKVGAPDALRYMLSAISYLALLCASWIYLIWPMIKGIIGLKDGITSRDRLTESTYVRQ